MSWQFIGSPASPSTLAAPSIALSFLGLASALAFFAFLATSGFASALFACSTLGSAGFPSSGFASLAALLFLAFVAMLVFFALMMHLRNDVSMGLAAIVRRREPPVATPRGAFRHALSACISYLAGAKTSSVLRVQLS